MDWQHLLTNGVRNVWNAVAFRVLTCYRPIYTCTHVHKWEHLFLVPAYTCIQWGCFFRQTIKCFGTSTSFLLLMSVFSNLVEFLVYLFRFNSWKNCSYDLPIYQQCLLIVRAFTCTCIYRERELSAPCCTSVFVTVELKVPLWVVFFNGRRQRISVVLVLGNATVPLCHSVLLFVLLG